MKPTLPPLSAVELADAERTAARLIQDRELGPNQKPWIVAFLRLLALHRAMERQSAILQSQVRSLTDDNLKLEAAMDARAQEHAK